ncbi:polysaccharide pyruvyl transferase family protein [Weeksellaceae bacterium KMM 9724]|uniref:polysaccharide pyruvyl transferase family protein n=1 Tax=Profundicola chukchiensis TaxID=2961959 RepID=UPI002439C914|nr:polysaccharide pyruvyl transferase family protein [Profundicola chukchiensis]MDG4949423.1 polysaccharide pyruvyl transferase family protein [Profundicola chukchiensis]
MSQIIFNGFYGFKNTGDDAFVEIASWGSKTYWDNKEITYFSGDDLPNTQIPIKEIYSPNTHKISQKISVFNASLKSDYFINAGGSVFSEIRPLSNIAFAQKARWLNPKLKHAAIGVSIGPFANIKNEKAVQNYLRSLKFLALRDTYSYEYAKSLDLDYEPIKAFDLAALLPFCYENSIRTKKESKQKTIGISICNYERYINGDIKNEERRNQFVENVLTRLAKNKEYSFKFFIFNGNKHIGDERLTHSVASLLPKEQYEIVPYSKTTLSTWREIQACDFMFSTRLHASIFACYAGVPFMLIEYHRKCSNFLDDIGYDKNARIYDGEKNPEEVAQDIARFVSGDYTFPSHVNETIERAKLNFTQVQL